MTKAYFVCNAQDIIPQNKFQKYSCKAIHAQTPKEQRVDYFLSSS